MHADEGRAASALLITDGSPGDYFGRRLRLAWVRLGLGLIR